MTLIVNINLGTHFIRHQIQYRYKTYVSGTLSLIKRVINDMITRHQHLCLSVISLLYGHLYEQYQYYEKLELPKPVISYRFYL